MYFIASAGINGIPVIEKERWRTEAVPLVKDLRYDRDSPLYGLIKIVGPTGARRTVRFSTFINSLENLIRENEKFSRLDRSKQFRYLKSYWKVLREMYPEAFREDKISDYLVLRSISVYALNRLANDVFNWCQADGVEVPTEAEIRKYLSPLREFSWSKDNTEIAALGGQKGANALYEKLLEKLATGGIEKAEKRLENLKKERYR
jgi:hypothetical protein